MQRARPPEGSQYKSPGVFAPLLKRQAEINRHVRGDNFHDAGRGLNHIKAQLDMRYPHQGYQLAVACPEGTLDEAAKLDLKAAFDALHQRVYGANAADEEAEVVTFRVMVEIPVPQLELPLIPRGDGSPAQARRDTRPLYDLDIGSFREAAVYDRAKLRFGDRFEGPAVVEQTDATTVVLAGQRVEVDPYRNLVIATGVS